MNALAWLIGAGLLLGLIFLAVVVCVLDHRLDQARAVRDQGWAAHDEQTRRGDRLQARLDTYRQVAAEHVDRLVPDPEQPLPRRQPQPEQGQDL